MKNYVVKNNVTINAPPEDVWDALTNPEKTKKYLFNSEVFSDWKTGSPITFKGHQFLIIPTKISGTINRIIPGKLLEYTLSDGKRVHTVTDQLTFADRQTTLHLTDDLGQDEDAEKRYIKSVKSWDKILKRLKKFVEHN
jgi:uncharacterized protein YndB with AHSA1/START domain